MNRLYVLLILSVFLCHKMTAQTTMCINYKDGSVYEVPIERIDSITFIEKCTE